MPDSTDVKKRFWVSWYSTEDDGDKFTAWCTGSDFQEPPRFTYCAIVDASDEEHAQEFVLRESADPNASERFCEERPAGHLPYTGNPKEDRFQPPDVLKIPVVNDDYTFTLTDK